MEFNPQELNLEIFNFGITTFSDFFNALLIVLHFVFLVGWSTFTYMVIIFNNINPNKNYIRIGESLMAFSQPFSLVV